VLWYFGQLNRISSFEILLHPTDKASVTANIVRIICLILWAPFLISTEYSASSIRDNDVDKGLCHSKWCTNLILTYLISTPTDAHT